MLTPRVCFALANDAPSRQIDGFPDDAEIGRNAISTIAKARRSNFLNNWLLTGRQDSDTMSVDEALRHLNVEQKLEDIEQTLFPADLTTRGKAGLAT